MRHVCLALFGALLCACTQDFNKFLGDGGTVDDGGADVDAAPPCTVPQACITNASACGQACVSGYNTCTGGCGGSQSCKSQCKNQETTCSAGCVTTCVSCSDAGTCATTDCQAVVP